MRLKQLGNELLRLRGEAGISREQVADATGISSPTLSRIENAVTTISPDTVAKLVDLYGRPDLKADLIELAKTAQKRGWWHSYRDVFKGAFVGFEYEADGIWTFEPLVAPGLTQIPDYMRALVQASPSPIPDETEDRRVEARSTRQSNLLSRRQPPQMTFVLGEAVLHQEVGGREVLSRQISHLWDMSQRSNITVLIVSFSAGAHHGLDGGFTVLSYGEIGMEIAFVEDAGGNIYLESQSELAGITLRRESILKAALSPIESAEMLRDFADRTRK